MYLNDVLKEFLLEIRIKNYTVRTQKGYKNNNLLFITYLKNEFEIEQLEDVTHLHIKSYVKYLHSKCRKPTYINGILKNIRSFLKYCKDEGYISKNPSEKVNWQKEGKVLINSFSDDEVLRMLSVYGTRTYLEARNKCIMALLFDTGIRNFELCSMTHSNVRESVIKIDGKGNKERVVSISPMLKKIMMKYERIKDHYFKDKNIRYGNYFLSFRCEPLTVEAVERVVRKCGVEAGVRKEIRCSPHTCRHYFAQAQLRNGLDVYSLSRLLGHESLVITKRYLQSIQDEEILNISIKTSPLQNLKK